jgi:hypothetical protein
VSGRGAGAPIIGDVDWTAALGMGSLLAWG